MDHVRGAPHHPQTPGKIERWHQTMKNRVLLESDVLPGDLERKIGAFVDHSTTALMRAWQTWPRPTSTTVAARRS